MGEKRYEQVAAALLRRVQAGDWALGDTLPTENELAEQADVSRSTVRMALQQLADWGMVSRRRRRGTVLTAKEPRRVFRQQVGALDQLEEFAERTDLEILDFADVSSSEIRDEYDIEETVNQRWVRYTALRRWKDSPEIISWTVVSFDGLYEGAKAYIGQQSKPTYRILEDAYGLSIRAIRQDIKARVFGDDLVDLLRAPAHTPALEVVRVMYTADRDPILVAKSVHRADAVTLRTHLRLRGIGEDH